MNPRKHFFNFKKSLLLGLALLFAGFFATAWLLTPSNETLRQIALGSDRVFLDRDGSVLQVLRTNFNAKRVEWYEIGQFSKAVKEIVVLAEDQRFFSHFGVDIKSVGGSLLNWLHGRPIRGASTISMQLADLVETSVLIDNQMIAKRSFRQKIRQIFFAIGLEMRWTKPQILEAYLNLIHLRGEIHGVPTASLAYFKKHASLLSPEESALLAALIRSPNQSVAVLEQRACALLRLNNRACDTIDARSLYGPARLPDPSSYAPHLARILIETESKEPVYRTHLRLDLQIKVAEILQKNIKNLDDRNVRDAAAIVVDNISGEVLAYVGSVSSSDSPHVNGVESYRQAGSTLKPFIYARALERKLVTAASILVDDPTVITWEGGVYRPTNYSRQFYGPVSVREALASSLNVPAVKVATIIGLPETYNVLKQIGLSQLQPSDFYGVSMALGAVDVRLSELTNAYRSLANGGIWSPLSYIKGATAKAHRVFSNEAAFVVTDILSDAHARAMGFGWNSPLETPFWTAVKTGTSKDYRDNWCVGFSRKYSVGVWVGNFDSSRMDGVSGVAGAGPAWFEIMSYLHQVEKSLPPVTPNGIVQSSVRHEWQGRSLNEFFLLGTEPKVVTQEIGKLRRSSFVFPSEGSILVKDPRILPELNAISIRFKGSIPPGSQIFLNSLPIGAAVSPFEWRKPVAGRHRLSIVDPDGKDVAQVGFSVRDN